ncbi:hypothetical protein IAT38_007331 [Cryptococcus sp. DSM 104549]
MAYSGAFDDDDLEYNVSFEGMPSYLRYLGTDAGSGIGLVQFPPEARVTISVLSGGRVRPTSPRAFQNLLIYLELESTSPYSQPQVAPLLPVRAELRFGLWRGEADLCPMVVGVVPAGSFRLWVHLVDPTVIPGGDLRSTFLRRGASEWFNIY